eukprot:jgi/Mesvir1/19819/Mv13109-RA.1
MAAAKRGKKTTTKKRTKRHVTRSGEASRAVVDYAPRPAAGPAPNESYIERERPRNYVYDTPYETEEQRLAREYTSSTRYREKKQDVLARALVRDGYDELAASNAAADICLLDGRVGRASDLRDDYLRWSAKDALTRAATRRPRIEDAILISENYFGPSYDDFFD